LARAEEGLRCAGVRAEVLLGEPRRLHAGECGRARAIDTSSSAEASIARRHARRDGSCMPSESETLQKPTRAERRRNLQAAMFFRLASKYPE